MIEGKSKVAMKRRQATAAASTEKYRLLLQQREPGSAKLKELEDAIAELEGENSSLRFELSSTKEPGTGVAELVAELMGSLSTLNEKLDKSSENTKKHEATVENLQMEILKIRKDRDREEANKLKEFESVILELKTENNFLKREMSSKEKHAAQTLSELEAKIEELQSDLVKLRGQNRDLEETMISKNMESQTLQLREELEECVSSVNNEVPSYVGGENSLDDIRAVTIAAVEFPMPNGISDWPRLQEPRNTLEQHDNLHHNDCGEFQGRESRAKLAQQANKCPTEECDLIVVSELKSPKVPTELAFVGRDIACELDSDSPSRNSSLEHENQLITMEESFKEQKKILLCQEEKVKKIEKHLKTRTNILAGLAAENKTLQVELDKERSWRCDLEDESRELRLELEAKMSDLDVLQKALHRIEKKFIDTLRNERSRRADAEMALEGNKSHLTLPATSERDQVVEVGTGKENYLPQTGLFKGEIRGEKGDDKCKDIVLSPYNQDTRKTVSPVTPSFSGRSSNQLNTRPSSDKTDFNDSYEINSMMEI